MKNIILFVAFVLLIGNANGQNLLFLDGEKAATPLPIANGGTGSSTLNFVDLTSTQNITGTKTFASVNLTTTPIITTATKVLVKNPTTGQISEQNFPIELPTQTGQANKSLVTDGTAVSWQEPKVFAKPMRYALPNQSLIVSPNTVVANGGSRAGGVVTLSTTIREFTMADGAWEANLLLSPANPTESQSLHIRNSATFAFTIGVANTNLAVPLVLANGQSATFVSSPSGWRWVDTQPQMPTAHIVNKVFYNGANLQNSTTTMAAIPALSFNVVIGWYRVKFYPYYNAASTATGAGFNLGSGTAVRTNQTLKAEIHTTTGAMQVFDFNNLAENYTNTASPRITDNRAYIEAIFQVTTAGNYTNV